jgi:hypothetical protein
MSWNLALTLCHAVRRSTQLHVLCLFPLFHLSFIRLCIWSLSPPHLLDTERDGTGKTKVVDLS